jgi:hypothetical protein
MIPLDSNDLRPHNVAGVLTKRIIATNMPEKDFRLFRKNMLIVWRKLKNGTWNLEGMKTAESVVFNIAVICDGQLAEDSG